MTWASIPVRVLVTVVVTVPVCWIAVVVSLNVFVMVDVLVAAGGVIVVIGVYVDLTIAVAGRVNTSDFVGTGLFAVSPRRVAQRMKDFVESAKAGERSKAPASSWNRAFFMLEARWIDAPQREV